MNRILLTDAQQRKTLACARSLGKRGVQVLTAEVTRCALAKFSRYCRQGFVCPNAVRKPDDFYYWLLKTLHKYPCDVLFPMDDGTMEVVMKYREQLEKLCRLPIPPTESYLKASDKAQATLEAMASGLKCPKTVIINNLDELAHAAAELNFPVVIKPRKSSGSRGITIVWQVEDFFSEYMKVHKNYPLPIIQEYISPGEKYDVCLLFNRSSQLKASFVQKEIRFFPLERGPSTVQESVWRPDLVEMAFSLMQRLNWYGIAEVEFMIDPKDGQIKFMEINPRFWGSLHLSILSGVDFPWLLYRLAMEGDIEECNTYKTGIKCRWLLPGDLLHFIFNKNRFAMDPPFICTNRAGVYDDIVSLADPLPTLGFFLACLYYLPDLSMWRFMFNR